MAIPFNQSMDSVHKDRGNSSLISIALAILFFALWVTWFFFAPITRYETGIIIGVTRNDRIVAEFPIHAVSAIRQGQIAHIRPHILMPSSPDGMQLPQDQVGSMSARVAELIKPTTDDSFQVEFYVQWDKAFLALFERTSGGKVQGEVEIEIESISPATLVARASGQLMDTPALSFTPGDRP